MNDLAPEEKSLAIVAHLSGLAGYLVPLGGVLAPVLLWLMNGNSRHISTIAKQALWLNVMVYVGVIVGFVSFYTVVGIPCALLLWAVLGIAAVLLPVLGAFKASEGKYYKYPVIGLTPPPSHEVSRMQP